MRSESLQFLRKLVETPSPSGFERPIQQVVARYLKPYVDDMRKDVHGNLIAVKNPAADLRLMLAGHCDEIGLMVNHVDDKGYLFVAAIGGVDPALTEGQRVTVHSEKGDVPGVVGRKPIHLTPEAERGKAAKIHEQWVDIGAKGRRDALKAVAIGDPMTVAVGMQELRNGLVAARGLDDCVGVFTMAETMRLISRKRINIGVYGVSTVQEELGTRGAVTSTYGVNPNAGIAIEVGFASDFPEADKKRLGEIALGEGPILQRGANINPVLGRMLEQAAREKRIRCQVQALPAASRTDANTMQLTRAGVATALVRVACRYMHSPAEVVSLADMESAARLIAAVIVQMKDGTDFTP